jgi:regulatory protein YycH of two-component signal transduction system YycFG
MNIGKHIIEYQLFLKDYPIYSNSTVTRIATTWGENRIFRYRRPYYSIESDIERAVKQLPSGAEIVAYLENNEDYLMKDIDEVVIGYYLTQDQNAQKLFLLEPSWFIISNNMWTRISPERLGGTNRGLE